MQRCLDLAEQAKGNVAPNPMVGAVLVYEGKIIGEGYHKEYGKAHAEVNCIHSVESADLHKISSATLYVSLEPCSHHGKTPPCADLIIKHQIPRIVIGCRDSFSEVNGRGIQNLLAAGIVVTEGVMEKECKALNKCFFVYHQAKRPFILLKWAQSNNGMIAGKDFKRINISNEYTNRLVHKWRSEESSILIGTNTVLSDDPSLTTRLWKGKDPVRLVLDNSLRLPTTLHVFDKEVRTIILNNLKEDAAGNPSFLKVDPENFLHSMINRIFQLGIQSVLVEGGAKLIQTFIDADIWDEARVIQNTELSITNGIAAPNLAKAMIYKQQILYNDLINYFIPSDL